MSFNVEIIQRDVYADNGLTDYRIPITVANDFTAAGWACSFTVKHRRTGVVLISTDLVAIVSATQVKIELTSSDTALAGLLTSEDFGVHPAELEFAYNSTEVIKSIHGVATIRQGIAA